MHEPNCINSARLLVSALGPLVPRTSPLLSTHWISPLAVALSSYHPFGKGYIVPVLPLIRNNSVTGRRSGT